MMRIFSGETRKRFQQRLVDVVGTLHRTPNGDAILWIRNRDHAVGLDVELLLRAGSILALDDVRRVAPNRIDIAFFHQEAS